MFPIRANIDGFLKFFIIGKNILKNVYICTKDFAYNGSVEGIMNPEV
jgi:hypothetical protein